MARRTFYIRTNQVVNGRTPPEYFGAFDEITNKYFALGMEMNESYTTTQQERDFVRWSVEMTGPYADAWAREIDQFFGSCVRPD